jgi:twitching motility protein PilT
MLAAVLDRINESHAYHILTIEDPIEFMHRHKRSIVHQRELHSDTPSFALALRAALRQAPKAILVGEMRDKETIEIALEAAETGHLVLSTLHTIDASKTVARIIGAFPMREQQIIRNRLGKSFRAIISQRLIPRKDGSGRVALVEILKSTLRTREYIERKRTGWQDAARSDGRWRHRRHAAFRWRDRETGSCRCHGRQHRTRLCHESRELAARADRYGQCNSATTA